MELTRHQGLGNVFLIALLEDLPDNPSEIARKYCDPINGIGADGLIIGTSLLENPYNVSRFHLFNKDGGRAELSGNGLRCFAQALFMNSVISDLEFNVETDVGSRFIKIEETGVIENQFTVAAEIGEASLIELSKSMTSSLRPIFTELRLLNDLETLKKFYSLFIKCLACSQIFYLHVTC